jgi:hypothetical protein
MFEQPLCGRTAEIATNQPALFESLFIAVSNDGVDDLLRQALRGVFGNSGLFAVVCGIYQSR